IGRGVNLNGGVLQKAVLLMTGEKGVDLRAQSRVSGANLVEECVASDLVWKLQSSQKSGSQNWISRWIGSIHSCVLRAYMRAAKPNPAQIFRHNPTNSSRHSATRLGRTSIIVPRCVTITPWLPRIPAWSGQKNTEASPKQQPP